MLSKFSLQTLKQKLWAIVAASFVSRIIMFFVLPSIPSALAPDEGAYANLAKWISEAKSAAEFPYFGEGLYRSGRSAIIPASALIKLGMNELDAVRVTSSIYGFLSLCLMAYLCLKLLNLKNSKIDHGSKIERLSVALIAIYAFLPSHFVWSNLGLRESPNEFWLIATFWGVFLLYREEQSKKVLIAALISLGIICTFSSRPQVGWASVATLLIYSLFKLKNKITYLLITSAITGLFAGYLATTPQVIVTREIYVAKDASTMPTTDLTPSNNGEIFASKLCDGQESKVEYEGNVYNCLLLGTETQNERPSNLGKVAIDKVEALTGKQIVNQVGAASSIERLSCPWQEATKIGKYGCLVFRAPYMTLTFLFRPLPFVDTTSTSSFFAATENIMWIIMFVIVFSGISRLKRVPFFSEIVPSTLFLCLYAIGAGSYEGNMGTAFRHKSLILWIVLLLIFAASWRSQGEEQNPQGNNSQESAV